MKCPLCNCELFIGNSKYVYEDNKLYMEQDMVCRNEKCSNHDKTVETEREELPLQTR